MTKKLFFITLPVCALVALSVAFLFTQPVFAQDEVPPEVVPTEVPAEVLPTEAVPVEVVPTEVAPTEVAPTEAEPVEVLPTEVAPSEALPTEVTLVEEVPTEEAPTEAAAVEDVPAAEPSLAEQLDDAGVMLADENGEVVSLASQDAQDLVKNSDPWYMVGTIKYSFMVECGATSNCISDPNPIQKAVDSIGIGPGKHIPSDGMIHFDAVSSYTNNVNINGVMGLKGMVGATSDVTKEPNVTIKGTLAISNMLSGFLLDGFNILGSAGAPDTDPADGVPDHPQGVLDLFNTAGLIKLQNLVVTNSDPTGQGIAIGEPGDFLLTHTRTVEMTNVVCSDNAGGGALVTANGAISVKNSSFERNGGNFYVSGLSIDTKGAVLLDGVSVNNNGLTDSASAAYINNSGTLTIKNSVFNGNSTIWGLTNYTISGTATLDNVNANDNKAGIWISSKGNLTANNVHTLLNDKNGAVFDTCWDSTYPYDDGLFDQTCTNPGVGNITITNSEFNNNSSSYAGLSVWAKGAITLTNVDASNNRGMDDLLNPTYTTAGARLQNYGNTGVFPVTVNSSSFNWNSDDGLEIFSRGQITVNKVHADSNGIEVDEFGVFVAAYDGLGMDIDNTYATAGVTINGTTQGDNTAYGNAYGIHVLTKGNILINYLDSTYNSNTNGRLDNILGLAGVTVNKSSFNHSWNGDALWISSRGGITLNSLTANDNYYGTYLDNSTATTPQPVTVNVGNFNNNGTHGLVVYTNGAITVSNITASGNTDYDSLDGYDWGTGAYLQNNTLNALGRQFGQPVTVNGGNFTGNLMSGLEVYTFGTITLTNINSTNNKDWGAYLTNKDATLPKNVTISNSLFNGNQHIGGLQILSRGAVTLSSVGVLNNSMSDETMDYGDTARDVTNGTDIWRFTGTAGDIINFGIDLANPNSTAKFNIQLYNAAGSVVSDAYCSDFSCTYNDPYYSYAVSGFTLPASGDYYFKVQNYYSDTSGVYYMYFWQGSGDWTFPGHNISRTVIGAAIQTDGAVTISNPNWTWFNYRFTSNNGYGLDIKTKGMITLVNVNGSYNSGYGADLFNRVDPLTAGMTLTGCQFDGNSEFGLNIETNGVVSLRNTISNANMDYGVSILNVPINELTAPGVTLYNDPAVINTWETGFNNNDYYGLIIQSKGPIVLTYITASHNNFTGVSLENDYGNSGITITNGYFDWNSGNGLEVWTYGSFRYTNGTARGNGGYDFDDGDGGGRGAYLNWVWNLNIANVIFSSNFGDGLYANANGGNITLSNVRSDSNRGWNDGDPDSDAMGAYLYIDNTWSNVGSISVVNGNFNSNAGTGVYTQAPGTVTFSTVKADNNRGSGAQIGPDYPVKSVTITGTSSMSEFNQNGDTGLEVYSIGNITLTNVSAAGNHGGGGAYLENSLGSVSIFGTVPAWMNSYSGNSGNGLEIHTNGTVTLNKIDASTNTGGSGVVALNQTGTVTITNSQASGNSGSGVFVTTKGAVLLSALTTNNNKTGNGTYINLTNDSTNSKTVSVTKSIFSGNKLDGLHVESKGFIAINNLTANGNTGKGVFLNNLSSGAIVRPGITVFNTLGANIFSSNGQGLTISSNGLITITGVTAEYNSNGAGIQVNDAGTTTSHGAVTITNVTTKNNHNEGISVSTNANITITGVLSMFNGLTLGDGDLSDGIYANTFGAGKTTINNGIVIGNGRHGILILHSAGPMPVIINTLYFGNNANGGVYDSNLLITT